MINEPYILIMELMNEYVSNVEDEGYSDLCETYSNQFNEPWYCETSGIIIDDNLTILNLIDSENLKCLIRPNTYGLVSLNYVYSSNKFWECLLDSYALSLGYVNGVFDYSLELEIKNIELVLKDGPITISRPFDDYGYFEQKSTINESKETLQYLIQNKNKNT